MGEETTSTLAQYIEHLKPKEQDYILFCLNKHTDKKGLHRGLLPFVPTTRAAAALAIQLSNLPGTERFIRQILSKIGASWIMDALPEIKIASTKRSHR